MTVHFLPSQVKVPRHILLHDQLTPAAKVLWAGLQLRPKNQEHLAQLCGLSQASIKPGQTQLERFSLLNPGPFPRADWAFLPVDLLRNKAVHPQAKITYAAIQLLPTSVDGVAEATTEQLTQLTGRHPATVRRALRSLVDAGWLQVRRSGRTNVLQILVLNPQLEAQKSMIAQINRRLERAPYLGEAIMREWLTLTVDRDNFEDDASPGFLVNPYTGEELKIDRLYPPDVGFEFNGPQHYGPTDLYPNEEQARRQMGRDLIKQAICTQRGILLVTIHAEDLSLEGMLKRLPDRLPLRSLDHKELVIAHLQSVSRAYRQKVPLPPPVPKQACPPGYATGGNAQQYASR